MEALASALLTIAAGTWAGAILFQSAVVAPAVFAELDSGAARRFLRSLFPRFYRLGLVCGGIMLAAIACLAALTGYSETLAVFAAATLLMLILEYLSLRLVPRINAARDAGEAGSSRFERLHRASVVMTVVILLLVIAMLGVIGGKTTVAPGL